MTEELEVAEVIEASTDRAKFALVASSLFLFAGGVAIGYFFSKQKYKKLYSDLAEQEIAEAKTFYSVLNKKDDNADPVQLAEEKGYEDVSAAVSTLSELTRDYRSDSVKGDVVVIEAGAEKVVNVFEVDNGTWNYDLEVAKRDAEPDEPYIISHEEFMQNEPEHDQITMTYYEGDEVLSDERDSPVENEEIVIGKPENLRFGHGSNDNNIVYIRNESSNTDFEIIKSTGKYAREVLGFIEHSDDSRKVRKFRLNE